MITLIESIESKICTLIESKISIVGSKVIMALTGACLTMFILIHLLGNMQLYAGRDIFNSYPELLRNFPISLWFARILLIFTFISHISMAVYLERKNKLSRIIQYNNELIPIGSSFASRTMLYSGFVIIAFVLFHLIHLTWKCFYVQNPNLDLYSLMIVSFRNPFITIFYILAQISLFLHLSHGFSSAAQTLSLTRNKLAKNIRLFGFWFAFIVTILYISIPVSILLRVIHD